MRNETVGSVYCWSGEDTITSGWSGLGNATACPEDYSLPDPVEQAGHVPSVFQCAVGRFTTLIRAVRRSIAV